MKKHTFKEIIEFFGSKADVARLLEITPQAVHKWGDTIPAGAAIKLEKLSDGRFRAVNMPVSQAA